MRSVGRFTKATIAGAPPGTLEHALDDLVESGVVSADVAAELRSGLQEILQDALSTPPITSATARTLRYRHSTSNWLRSSAASPATDSG